MLPWTPDGAAMPHCLPSTLMMTCSGTRLDTPPDASPVTPPEALPNTPPDAPLDASLTYTMFILSSRVLELNLDGLDLTTN